MHLTIFKTSVATKQQAGELQPILNSLPLVTEHNFDLDDSDNILRIVSSVLQPQMICEVLQKAGFKCEPLESFLYPY